jgi:hypothetical protein
MLVGNVMTMGTGINMDIQLVMFHGMFNEMVLYYVQRDIAENKAGYIF